MTSGENRYPAYEIGCVGRILLISKYLGILKAERPVWFINQCIIIKSDKNIHWLTVGRRLGGVLNRVSRMMHFACHHDTLDINFASKRNITGRSTPKFFCRGTRVGQGVHHTSNSKAWDPEIEIELDDVRGKSRFSWLLAIHLQHFRWKPIKGMMSYSVSSRIPWTAFDY